MADVQKSAFSLSSATLMMAPAFGASGIDVFSMTPALHSVGMVAQANVSMDSSLNELNNGVAQVVVDAKRTGIKTGIQVQVYEMTAQNYMRAMAMAGTALPHKRTQLTTALLGGESQIQVITDGVPGAPSTDLSGVGDIPANSTILIQGTSASGLSDYVFPTKSAGGGSPPTVNGSMVYTIPLAGGTYKIPTGMTFNAGAHVWIVNSLGIGNIDADDLFQVKITGILTGYDRPITAVFPKVRIVKGFEITYNETQYNSMPWEMQPLIMSAAEMAQSARLGDIGLRQPGLVYVGA